MSMYCICGVNGCAEENKAYSEKNFHDKVYKCMQYMIYIPVVPHEAVPEVSKGRNYNPEEHVPIESFVTSLID